MKINEPENEANKYRNKYSIDFKLKIIDMVNNGLSLHSIEKNIHLDRAMFRKWKEKEHEFRNMKYKDKLFPKYRADQPNKIMSDSQKEDICKFIKDCRDKKKHVLLNLWYVMQEKLIHNLH